MDGGGRSGFYGEGGSAESSDVWMVDVGAVEEAGEDADDFVHGEFGRIDHIKESVIKFGVWCHEED